MRSRYISTLLVLLIAVFVSAPVAVHAAPFQLAQEESTENENAEGGDTEGEGQSDPEAETGAEEGQTEEGTPTEEEGPPWTYQMARISLLLILVLLAGVGLLYYKLIASRQKGTA